MRSDFRCKLDYVISGLKCYVKEHKMYLLCLSATIVCGLVLGIIICSMRETITSRYNYIVLISNENYNLFGTFIKIFFLAFVGILLCYLQVYHKYLRCLPYIVLFYAAYRFGGRLVGIIVADKFVGFICIITFTIPIFLTVLVTLVVVSCICAHFRESCGGKGYVCKNINFRIIKYICFSTGILLLLLILFCIIVPVIAKFIIVV